MKQITCPHCGDTYPDFDVAHVCSKGPLAPKLKPMLNPRLRELMVQADYPAPELALRAQKLAELLFNEIANTAVVSDGMFNGDERRLYVELRLGDMVKKISVLGFEE